MGAREAGEALSYPGIDPRTWAMTARVESVTVAEDGVYLDLALLPDETPGRARLGTLYAGAGFGLYLPVRPGDLVAVVFPEAEPAEALAVCVLPHDTAAIPEAAQDAPDDLWLVARDGANVTIHVLGDGKLTLKAKTVSLEATDKVSINGEAAKAVLGDKLATLYAAHTHPDPVSGNTGTPSNALDSALSSRVLLG